MAITSITLTVNELVAALLLCNYGEAASEIINQKGLITNERKLARFIHQTETMLKRKGLMDETRETNLTEEFEALIHDLVQAEKKVRSVNIKNHSVLIVHFLDDDDVLIQHVLDGKHTLTYSKTNEFIKVFSKHHGLNLDEEKTVDVKTIQVSDSMFDEIHNTERPILEAMSQDESVDSTLRKFLKDFIRNEQELNNISFMISDYVEDRTHIDQISFLLPSDGMVWHLNYENILEHKIFIEPVSIKDYFKKIEDTTLAFFKGSITTIN